MTNMSENTEEAHEASPTLWHTTPMVVFHQDAPEFSPSVLPRGDEWPDLLAHADTDHRSLALTKTATPDPATSEAIGSSKINSKRARPTDGQTASPSLPANQDSDVTSVASIGESNEDLDYVESAEKSPMSPANTPDLKGHISELEEMHEVAEGYLVKLVQSTMLFSRIDEIEIPELNDANTNLLEHHQDNGATPPVKNQPYTLQSPLEYASVDSATPLPRPCI